MPEDFFEEQLPGSRIKTSIVSSYFWKWSKVMVARVKGKGEKIGYLDFFCGPGKYEDGTDSTPLVILKAAIRDVQLSKMLVSIFNDKKEEDVDKLEAVVKKLEGIEKLKYAPSFRKDTIGSEVVKELKDIELIPSLIFIDPFGYKGLSLDLIGSTIKDWGCDCIFFFNYNRINAAITNSFMKAHVDAIFGEETANFLRENVSKLNAEEREELILKCFMDELRKIKGEYSISFKFFQEDRSKTSHFIFFVAKHPLAYHLMKETMADNCEWRGGIPTYEYNPAEQNAKLTNLFSDDNYRIQDLADELALLFKGKITSRKQIYQEHSIGKPYVENNYKEALLILEQQGAIFIDPPREKRRLHQGKPTLGENLKITFKN